MGETYIRRSDGKTISIERIQAENSHQLKMKMENTASGQPIYIGEAFPGTTNSEAAWRIKKMEYDDGEMLPPTGQVWADGTSDFVKIWTLRASYSYS